jgi:hypothetical protein
MFWDIMQYGYLSADTTISLENTASIFRAEYQDLKKETVFFPEQKVAIS